MSNGADLATRLGPDSRERARAHEPVAALPKGPRLGADTQLRGFGTNGGLAARGLLYGRICPGFPLL